MTQSTTPGYPRTATSIAVAGGAIILLSGVLFLAVSAFVLPNLNYSSLNTPPNLSPAMIPALVSGFVGIMGAFVLISGAIVLIASLMLLTNSGQPRTWSVLILVFSILSFVGFGGFVVGAVLGIVGGAMVLRWKPPAQ